MSRRPGNGWVFKRPDTAGFYIGYSVRTDTGRKKIREFGGETKSAASALLRQRLREIDDNRWQSPTKPLTFKELEDMIRADFRAQGRRSWPRVENSLGHLRPVFGCMRVADINRTHLDRYVRDRLDAGAAVSTVRNELIALRRMMSLAVENNLLHTRPRFPKLKPTNTRQGFFERAEFDGVLHELPELVRPVVLLLFWSGWRHGEALSRQWRNVDRDAGTIRLEPNETKSGEGRDFPYGVIPELREVFEAQWSYTQAVQRRTGQVISHVFHREGEPIKCFRGAWKAACKRAALRALADAQGVEPSVVWKGMSREERTAFKGSGRLVHDLRRTAIRNWVRAGVSEKIAMELSGHATRSVFERYNITTDRDRRDAMARLVAAGPERGVLPLVDPKRTRQAASG